MNFTQNESQRELAVLSRRILTDRLTPEGLAAAEAAGDRFDPALWASLAGAGILAAGLPESVDGGTSRSGFWRSRDRLRGPGSVPPSMPMSALWSGWSGSGRTISA